MSQNNSLRIPDYIPHSPQKIYASQPNHLQKDPDLQAVYEYVPTLKQSGFIIGSPVAYTNQPYLPHHLSNTSPKRIENSPSRVMAPQIPHRQGSPNRSKSKSRVITNITYNNPIPLSQNSSQVTRNSRVIPAPAFINSPPISPSRPTSSLNFQPSRIQSEMVSQEQYQKCINQCRQWQQMYQEAIHNNSSTQITGYRNSSSEVEQLRAQNQRLRQKIRKLEHKQQSILDNLEGTMIQLTNKYRDSTIKECFLLTDRYRLEKKLHQKN